MPQSLSIKLGKFLYKNAFPVYNRLYPIFKKNQDSKELALIQSFVKPGSTVLDIGANIGFYSDVFSNLVGANGHVYAFEPETTNFNYLQQNLKLKKNVTLVNKAISDNTGPIKIYLSKMLNVDHRTYPIEDYEQIIEIEAITIDDYSKSQNISKIDFIKMDIQGFEMSAFKGMKETLANNPKVKLITEFWPFGLSKAGSSATEVYDFLSSMNFNVYLILPEKLQLLSKENLKTLKHEEDQYYNILITKELQ